MIKIFLKIRPHRNAIAAKLKFLQPECSLSHGNCVSVCLSVSVKVFVNLCVFKVDLPLCI